MSVRGVLVACVLWSIAPAFAAPLASGEHVALDPAATDAARTFTLTAPATGAFIVRSPTPERLTLRWMDAAGIALGSEPTIFAAAGARLDLWAGTSDGAPAELTVDFSAEPYAEPDDAIATATPLAIGVPATFRLMPRRDVDMFAVTAPARGTLILTVLDPDGHQPAWTWQDAAGTVLRDNEATVWADAGVTLYLAIRSAYWADNAQARLDPVRIQVDFSAEPYAEPDGTVATATPLAIGTVATFRLMPRRDVDMFAVMAPADGTLTLTVLDPGGHQPAWTWQAADGTVLRDGEATVAAKAGETLYLAMRSSYWPDNETARPDPLRIRVDFSVEPYDEPNDTVATATPLAIGAVAEFRLMPRRDFDMFAVTAPGNGVLTVTVLDAGGHQPYWTWQDAAGAVLRDGEATVTAKAGETLYLAVRSSYWPDNEQARPDPLRMRVDFSAEPYGEPNDTVATATPLAIGAVAAFRLMPRRDVDMFAVTAPGDGTLAVTVLDAGGHQPYWTWQDAGGTVLRDGEATVAAKAGETVYLAMRSSYWPDNEQARPDPLRIRVDFSAEPYAEPDDTIATATPLAIGAVAAFRLMPRRDVDMFGVTAPADGTLTVTVLDAGGHQPYWTWEDGTGAVVRDGEATVFARAGETLYLAMRSSYWPDNEQARPDPLRIRVDFSAEPYAEPDDTIATATPLAIGAVAAFRLMPRRDVDMFGVTAPADGTLTVTVLDAGGHQPYWTWEDGTGAVVRDGEATVFARAGETLYLAMRSSYWPDNEQARPDPLRIRVDFSAEPYVEPDDTVATATPLAIGTVAAFRLTPRRDVDMFAVTAPADGTLTLNVRDPGGHQPYWTWQDGGGAVLRDGEASVFAHAGETLYLAMRSAYWPNDEQARPDPLRIRVDFSAEPYAEPDDTVATATPLAIGAVAEFRLMPRHDVDMFAITAPSDGTFVAVVLEAGGHQPYLTWLDPTGATVAEGTPEAEVAAGRTLILAVRSAYWANDEQSRPDPLRLLVRHRRPDGSWSGEAAGADARRLRPWQIVEFDPAVTRRFEVTAPQPGVYRPVFPDHPDLAYVWRQGETTTAESGARPLETGESWTVELAGDPPAPAGLLVATLELGTSDPADPPGPYPRLPIVPDFSFDRFEARREAPP